MFRFIILFVILSLPLKGEEILMKCVNKSDNAVDFYKWNNPLVGKTTIFLRREGEWVRWCNNESHGTDAKTWNYNSKIKLQDKGARCFTSYSKKYDDGSYRKGKVESFIDFEVYGREYNKRGTYTNPEGKKENDNETIRYVCSRYKKDD